MEIARYEDRIAAVRETAGRFPGLIDGLGHDQRALGLWAGIYLQTVWQMASGRDRLSIWHLVNANLTLVPRAYCREYLRDPSLAAHESPYVMSHPTRGGDGAPITHLDTCAAWKDYFRCQDEALALQRSGRPLDMARGRWRMRFAAPRKFWRAHNISIAQAVWQHRGELMASPLPERELAFWSGWIRFLLFCEKISPPTTDLVLMPLLKAVMPPRSPLNERDWRVQNTSIFGRAAIKAIAAMGDAVSGLTPRRFSHTMSRAKTD